jgi:hypothetical protein
VIGNEGLDGVKGVRGAGEGTKLGTSFFIFIISRLIGLHIHHLRNHISVRIMSFSVALWGGI